jgi:hypothetical protein
MSYRLIIVLLAATILPFSLQTNAQAQERICAYHDSEGNMVVRPQNKVPYRFKKAARCIDAKKSNYLAKPDQIELKGNVRKEDVSSSLGRIELRWPRSVEQMFGRTPLRAVTDAARTVSRTLKTSGFPPEVQNLNAPWKIIFLDANLSKSEIPHQLISRCHPGWMTPPANIYIVAQRVAEGCGGARNRSSATVADSQLTEILLHEMGHVVEYYLLNKRQAVSKVRAEGFATWFEIHSSQFSSLLSQSKIRSRTFELARRGMRKGQHPFNGSAEDYATASMIFSVIADRRGVRGISDVYQTMNKKNLRFPQAVREATYLSIEQIEKDTLKLLK